jgi:hypothetical protein
VGNSWGYIGVAGCQSRYQAPIPGRNHAGLPKDTALSSDKQWFVAIDNIRFGFDPSHAANGLIGIPPGSQEGSQGEAT